MTTVPHRMAFVFFVILVNGLVFLASTQGIPDVIAGQDTGFAVTQGISPTQDGEPPPPPPDNGDNDDMPPPSPQPPAPPPDTPSQLTAQITSPQDGAVVSGITSFLGTAAGEGFVLYALEYSFDELQTESWTLLASSDNPIVEGVLATWDTAQIADGSYTIRLTAVDTDDATAEARVTLLVDNTPPTIKDVLPEQGAVASPEPTISALLTDNLSGINENTILVRLNENEVHPAPDFDSATGLLSWTSLEPLQDGVYEVTIDVEDKAGHEAVQAKTSFRITHITEPIVVAPNPVRNGGAAFFYIVPPGATEATIMVFNVSGRLLFETSIDTDANRFPAAGQWDPVDGFGVKLANGPYLCTLVVDGATIGWAKMVIQR